MRILIDIQIKTLERAGGFIVFSRRYSGRQTGKYIPLNQIVWC